MTASDSTTDKLLTPREMAEVLQVTPRTLHRLMLDGCPSYKVGVQRRYDPQEVRQWLRERQPSSPRARRPGGRRTRRALTF